MCQTSSKNITLKDFRITHFLPAHKTSPCTGQPRLSLLLGMYEEGIIKPTKVNKFTLVVNIRRLTSHLFVHKAYKCTHIKFCSDLLFSAPLPSVKFRIEHRFSPPGITCKSGLVLSPAIYFPVQSPKVHPFISI
jgi:hypothetical protein